MSEWGPTSTFEFISGGSNIKLALPRECAEAFTELCKIEKHPFHMIHTSLESPLNASVNDVTILRNKIVFIFLLRVRVLCSTIIYSLSGLSQQPMIGKIWSIVGYVPLNIHDFWRYQTKTLDQSGWRRNFFRCCQLALCSGGVALFTKFLCNEEGSKT